MGSNIADNVDRVVSNLAVNMASNLIAEIPIAGLFARVVFDTIMQEFGHEIDDLREELEASINSKISDYAGDTLKLDLEGLGDRLQSYKDNGESPEELQRLNEDLEGNEAKFLKNDYVVSLNRLPLTLGFMFLRTVVWQRIEADGKMPVDVKKQVQDFSLRSFPLVDHLIQEVVQDRLSTIKYKLRVERDPQLILAFWDIFDGDRFVESLEAQTNVFEKEASEEKARKATWECKKDVEEKLRKQLSKKYLNPLLDLVTIYKAHIITKTKLDGLGDANGPLANQHADYKTVMCGEDRFVTGMCLYKHHNNMAIGLTSQLFDKVGERLVGNTLSEKDDSLGSTSRYPLADQHADYKTVMCPPGEAVVGACLYKHHNNLAIQIYSKSLTHPLAQPTLNNDNELGDASAYPLKDQWIDTRAVSCPAGHVVIGCKFYKHHNQLAIELISADVDAVLSNIDFRNPYI